MQVAECQAWLMDHLCVDLGCVTYLLEKEQELHDFLLHHCLQKKLPKKKSSGGSGGDSSGDDDGEDSVGEKDGNCNRRFDLVSWLHLIHAAMDDKAQPALNHKYSAKSHQEFEASTKRSKVCLPTFEEVVAKIYNDETVKYISEVMTHHEFFATSMRLNFEDTIGLMITPQNVKNQLGGLRSVLVTVSNHFVYAEV
jgi:hypothetical protein